MQNDLNKSLEILRQGGVILYPTDTLWGLGCDATNENAVKRIFDIKKRVDTKEMLVMVDNAVKILSYVEDVPEIAWDLIELSKEPLTIIYPNAINLASNLVADDKSIGIRVTNEAFLKKLCSLFRKPIASTSANISGEPTQFEFNQISDAIKIEVDYVVNFRKNKQFKPKPSSIIKLGKGNLIQVIRD